MLRSSIAFAECGPLGYAQAMLEDGGIVRPKITFIINSLAGGGAERVMATLMTHSQAYAADHDFELVLLDDELQAYELPEWLRVTRLGGGGGLGASLIALGRHLQRTRPDGSLSFLTRANICNAIVMNALRRPFAVSERVHTSAHLGNGGGAAFAKFLVARTYPSAHRVIAVSQGVGDHLVERFGVPEERVVAVSNPFDLARIEQLAAEPPAWAPDGPYILAMGRLASNKNFPLAIRAYAEAGIEPTLVIAGEGPQRAEIEALIESLGLKGRVILPGFAANPYALMRGAEYYVLPSNAEGFPNGLVEAMAVGLPVLSTDCPSGPAEILEATAPSGLVAARHGLLVPCDSVDAMAAGMRRLGDPAERERYGKAAKARARNFDVAATVDTYWRIVGEVLRAGKR